MTEPQKAAEVKRTLEERAREYLQTGLSGCSLRAVIAGFAREVLEEAAKASETHGKEIGEHCWNHENRTFDPPMKGSESKCWHEIAAAIRQMKEGW